MNSRNERTNDGFGMIKGSGFRALPEDDDTPEAQWRQIGTVSIAGFPVEVSVNGKMDISITVRPADDMEFCSQGDIDTVTRNIIQALREHYAGQSKWDLGKVETMRPAKPGFDSASGFTIQPAGYTPGDEAVGVSDKQVMDDFRAIAQTATREALLTRRGQGAAR